MLKAEATCRMWNGLQWLVYRSLAEVESGRMCSFFSRRLYRHGGRNDPCPVTLLKTAAGSTNRKVGHGLSQLWFPGNHARHSSTVLSMPDNGFDITISLYKKDDSMTENNFSLSKFDVTPIVP